MPTHWLYAVNPDSDYVLVRRDGTQVPVTAENLWEGIIAEEGSSDLWYLSSGFRTMQPGDWVWIYVSGRQEICALGYAQRIYQDEGGLWYVDALWDQDATAALRRAPIPRSAFHEIPQAPRRANPNTVRVLEDWLSRKRLPKPPRSMGSEPEDLNDARRRVLAEIVRRQGQGRFRDALRRAHGDRCAATGEAPSEVLEAAHVDPYLGPKSNHLDNGLLLRADMHTLFDLHLIAVSEKGCWMVSPLLRDTAYGALAGKGLLQSSLYATSSKRLARHRALLRGQ